MTVPTFSDIGKRIKDLIEKDFPAGIININGKFSSSDIKMTLKGTENIDSGKVSSALETKFPMDIIGHKLTLTEKWTTGNEIQSLLEVTQSNNLKNTLEIDYEPSTGRKTCKLKNNLQRDFANLDADLEFRQLQPIITLSGVFKPMKLNDIYAGASVSLDTYKRTIERSSYGIQISNPAGSVVGAFNLTNHKQLKTQLLVNPRSDLSLAAELNATLGSNTHKLILCSKKVWPETQCAVKAKFECSMNLSLAYSFPIREGVMFTFGSRLDLKNLNGGGHKLGFQIDV